MYKKLENIVFITAGKYKDGVIAFAFEEGNKGQEETAKNWAGEGSERFVFTNDGFEARISEAARNSYRINGKLSFWMVEVTKDGKSFNVGINSELLLECIQHATIEKGKFVGEMAFMKDGAKLGIVEIDSDLYKQILADESKRKSLGKRKTSKPSLGVVHESITQSNVLICKLYDWYKSDGFESVEDAVYKDNKIWPYYLYLYTDTFNKWEGSKLSNCLKDEEFVSKLADVFNFASSSLVSAIPTRSEGRLFIEVDVTPDQISSCLNKARNIAYRKFMDEDRNSNHIVPKILKMSFSLDKKPCIDDVLEVAARRYSNYIKNNELERMGITKPWF